MNDKLNTSQEQTQASDLQSKKVEKRKFTSFITNNLGRKIISLFFAILIWSYVINETNPIRSTVFNDLTLGTNYEYTLKNAGLVLQEDANKLPKIKVSLNMPYKEFRNINAANIDVYIDLSKVTSIGTFDLPVYATCSNADAVITSCSPSFVTVTIDELATAEVPVVLSYSGTPSQNLYYEQCTVSPNILKISGPKNYVSKIAKAQVNIDLSKKYDGTPISLPYTFVDTDGNTVSAASIDVADNKTNVLVDGIKLKKSVPVEYMSHLLNTDKLAQGYKFIKAESDPTNIEIIGNADTLKNIDKLHIKDIDFTGMDNTINQIKPELVIPKGITASDTPVILDVSIGETEISKEFDVKIKYTSPPSGTRYKSSTKQTTVTLSGKYFTINSIKDSDMEMVINLSSLSKGTHELTLSSKHLVADMDVRGISIESISPEKVTVEIY